MPRPTPDPPAGSVPIPASVVQHTIQDIMVQGQQSPGNYSTISMFESHEATRLGVPAFVRGSQIHFAPGAFQPGTEAGRSLILNQLRMVSAGPNPQSFHMAETTPAAPSPVPIPYPNLSLSSTAAPFSHNVLISAPPGISEP